MYISKIELTKFKSYQHAELKFPEPTEGKNIVLIGGMNGFGKTTILEALYLCLYGKDALPHLARAGLKTDDVRGYAIQARAAKSLPVAPRPASSHG